MVFSGLVTACRLATCPTRRSPPLVMATTEGVVRAPSWLGMTTGSPPCITATTEFVAPKSIPIILLMLVNPPLALARGAAWVYNACRTGHLFRYSENYSGTENTEYGGKRDSTT